MCCVRVLCSSCCVFVCATRSSCYVYLTNTIRIPSWEPFAYSPHRYTTCVCDLFLFGRWHAPSSRHRWALLSACGRCSFGGLVVRVCAGVGGVFSVGVSCVRVTCWLFHLCVWPVSLPTCVCLCLWPVSVSTQVNDEQLAQRVRDRNNITYYHTTTTLLLTYISLILHKYRHVNLTNTIRIPSGARCPMRLSDSTSSFL